MRSLLYIIAVILVIGWIFGFFVYSLGGLIHILLIFAVISVMFQSFVADDSCGFVEKKKTG